MAGMTFLEIQTAVMGTRFDDSQRGDIKTWINDAYWACWTQEEWTFKYATDTVSVTNGSTAVTGVATDVVSVRAFSRGDGETLDSVTQADYQRLYYNPRSPWTGRPDVYTVINGSVFVGPASNETASDYQITYEKEYQALVNDGDVPMIPAGAHEGILVFGALSTGLQTENDFTWSFFQQKYDRSMDTLRRGYLVDRRDQNAVYAADPLGGY